MEQEYKDGLVTCGLFAVYENKLPQSEALWFLPVSLNPFISFCCEIILDNFWEARDVICNESPPSTPILFCLRELGQVRDGDTTSCRPSLSTKSCRWGLASRQLFMNSSWWQQKSGELLWLPLTPMDLAYLICSQSKTYIIQDSQRHKRPCPSPRLPLLLTACSIWKKRHTR